MAQYDYLILSPSLSDAGTLTAASSASGFGVANLQSQAAHKVWRSNNLTSQFLQIDLGAGYSGDINNQATFHVWLGYTNARSATTWRVRFDDDSDPTTSPDHDSGVISIFPSGSMTSLDTAFPDGVHGYYAFGPTFLDCRYIRIDLADASHPDGYFQASRIVVGIEFAGNYHQAGLPQPTPVTAWSPSYGAAYGSGVPSEQEPEDSIRADGGQLWPFERERPASVPYRFKNLSRQEVSNLRELYRFRGTSKDIVSIMDPSTTQYLQENTVHGFLRDFDTPTWKSANDNAHEVSFEVEALL